MERLQGPINSSSFFGQHLDVDFLEQGLTSTGNLRFEEEEAHFSTPGLDDTMPFLQMLQSVATPPFLPMKEPSFQTLLKLQHLQKPWEIDSQIQALELESCVTHDMAELHSPIKSEARDIYHLHSISGLEGVSSQYHQELPSSMENTYREDNSGSNPTWVHTPTTKTKQTPTVSKASPATRERKKRKRTRPTKNKEEVESQRMTHIAVERNRRRQMNDHLNVLRSLMPTSYIQRGDQASIVGGAIDFVKELEQLLQSLEAQKRMRKAEGGENCVSSSSSSSAAATAPATALAMPSNGMFMSLSQYKIGSEEGNHSLGDEVWAENKSEAADIEVTVIQTHVNLKIQCRRRPGQLLKAIVALEELRLTILHLNITTSQSTVFYSVNLKIEDGCKLGSADEIAGAVHQIFRFIDST